MIKGWLKAGLIILVLGLMAIGIGGKGCNPWAKDDDSSGSSGVGPFELIATAVSDSQIDLTWKHGLNPVYEPPGTGFELQRKTGAQGTYQTIATLGLVTSYQDTSLDPDTTYYYRVRAMGDGPSYGAEETFTTLNFETQTGNRIGEFAIGTNTGLTELIYNILQDEKFPGVHIAFGSPLPGKTGANWDSKAHVDGVIKNPSIYVDGEMIMDKGEFCFEEFV